MTAYNTTYYNGNFNNGLYAYHNSAVSEFISVSDNVKTQIIDMAANIGSATLNTFTSGTFTCNDPGTYLVEFGLEAGPSNFTASDLISTKIFIEDEDNTEIGNGVKNSQTTKSLTQWVVAMGMKTMIKGDTFKFYATVDGDLSPMFVTSAQVKIQKLASS